MLYCPTPGEHVARKKTKWPTSGEGGHEIARRTPAGLAGMDWGTDAVGCCSGFPATSPGDQDAVSYAGYKSVAFGLLFASYARYARMLRGRDSNPELRDMNPPCCLCTTPRYCSPLSRGAEPVMLRILCPTIYRYTLLAFFNLWRKKIFGSRLFPESAFRPKMQPLSICVVSQAFTVRINPVKFPMVYTGNYLGSVRFLAILPRFWPD